MLSLPHPPSPSPHCGPHQEHQPRMSNPMPLPVVISPPTSCPLPPQQSLHPARSARPKLKLDTAQVPKLRTYGKSSSTSLRLDTLSAISPTVRNTYSNALESAKVANRTEDEEEAPSSALTQQSQSSRTPSTSSISSASTFSDCGIIPYKLSHSVKSILVNSPIPRTQARRMSISRPLFPPTKRVSFRFPLAEEIKTTIYITAHSDVFLDQTETASTEAVEPATSTVETVISPTEISNSASALTISTPTEEGSDPTTLESSLVHRAPPPRPRRIPHSPLLGCKRDSASSEESGSDSDEPPDTPIAGRCKRRREWAWTLGPLPGMDGSMETPQRTESQQRPSVEKEDEAPISPRSGPLLTPVSIHAEPRALEQKREEVRVDLERVNAS